jgi:hypothetical protein
MTNEQENPWWQVDIQRTCAIDTITIYNRTDNKKCGEKERLRRLTDIDEDQEIISFSDAAYLVENNPYCLTGSPMKNSKSNSKILVITKISLRHSRYYQSTNVTH